jgi:hypothetical protein
MKKSLFPRLLRLIRPPSTSVILARRELEELESEKRRETTLAASEDVLEAMGDDALKENARGKTRRI